MDHASLEVMPMTPAEDEEADVAENNMMDCQEAHAPDNDLLKEKTWHKKTKNRIHGSWCTKTKN